jgi:hypothetical protein
MGNLRRNKDGVRKRTSELISAMKQDVLSPILHLVFAPAQSTIKAILTIWEAKCSNVRNKFLRRAQKGKEAIN